MFSLKKLDLAIYVAGLVLAGVWYAAVSQIASEGVQTIRLAETFALTALALLYAVLLVRPLYRAFPNAPLRGLLESAQKPLTVVMLAFALGHAYIAFFKMLGGFVGLGFLSPKYINAIILSATALVLLVFGAFSSWPRVTEKFSWVPRWALPVLHVAGLLILIHAVMLGAHFADLTKFIPQLALYLLIVLLILDSLWLDSYLSQKFQAGKRFGIVFVLLMVLLAGAFGWLVMPQNANNPGLGIHSQHLQALQQASSQQSKYSVDMLLPATITPGKNTSLGFKIFNAETGQHITDYNIIHEKLMHLVVVNNALESYQHVHPELKNGVFTIDVLFPSSDLYHLYLSFLPTESPKGALEQQVAVTIPVGTFNLEAPAKEVGSTTSKTANGAQAVLTSGTSINSADIPTGKAAVKFEIKDAVGNPETNLQPYLAAFGHLVMVSTNDYKYVHVHPTYAPIDPSETAGPNLEFMIMDNINRGIYKLFLDINPGGQLQTAQFTAEVK